MHGAVKNSVPEKCAKGLPIVGQTMHPRQEKLLSLKGNLKVTGADVIISSCFLFNQENISIKLEECVLAAQENIPDATVEYSLRNAASSVHLMARRVTLCG